MKQTSKELTKNVVKNGVITEKEIALIMRRLNSGEKMDLSGIWNHEGIRLTIEQQTKGLSWLLDLYKTPAGKERKGNPYGFREIDILENCQYMVFRGGYDAGNCYHSWFVPLYEVHSKEDNMQYYMKNGNPEIIG